MKTVQVLLSSYNGEKYIEKQLDTIFSQKDVEVRCLVRDDGSNDRTIDILKAYQKKENRLRLVMGKNIGWRKSYMELLYLADDANYYAFSDQDDEWFEDKLVTGVSMLEKHPDGIPLLFHSARIRKTSTVQTEQQMLAKPLNSKNALMQEYCQGCSIMINHCAKDILCEYRPKGIYGHDFWVGVVCYFLGEVYYSSKPLFYHINHVDNTTVTGDINVCKKGRLKAMLCGKTVYNNPCQDLLDGYAKYLSREDVKMIQEVSEYKKNLLLRMKLLLDRQFVRNSTVGTFMLKVCILLGRY